MSLSTAFEHTIQVWKISDLYDVPIQQCFGRDKVSCNGREKYMFYLPADRTLFCFVSLRRNTWSEWFRNIKISELARE